MVSKEKNSQKKILKKKFQQEKFQKHVPKVSQKHLEKSGPKGPTVAAEGCSSPQELEKSQKGCWLQKNIEDKPTLRVQVRKYV